MVGTMKDELMSLILKDVLDTPCALFSNLDMSTNHDNSGNSVRKYGFSCGYPYDLNIHYTSYGPFSMIIITLFVLPVNVLNAVWVDVRVLNLVGIHSS